MTETNISTERRLPPIDKDLEDKVNEVLARYTGKMGAAVADDLIALGCDADYASNQAIHIMVTEAARIGVLSAHAFLKRPPRRDFWMDGAGEAFDDAVEWFSKFHGSGAFHVSEPVAETEDDEPRCIACDEPIEDGDAVYNDADGDLIHATCAGPERSSYTGPDGEPLADGDPIPEPWIWRKDAAAAEPLAELGEG